MTKKTYKVTYRKTTGKLGTRTVLANSRDEAYARTKRAVGRLYYTGCRCELVDGKTQLNIKVIEIDDDVYQVSSGAMLSSNLDPVYSFEADLDTGAEIVSVEIQTDGTHFFILEDDYNRIFNS